LPCTSESSDQKLPTLTAGFALIADDWLNKELMQIEDKIAGRNETTQAGANDRKSYQKFGVACWCMHLG
jgi:hypothetical protein